MFSSFVENTRHPIYISLLYRNQFFFKLVKLKLRIASSS